MGHTLRSTTTPRCIPLGALSVEEVGGKAKGLAKLLAGGFTVPDGFVVSGATIEQLPDDLEDHYARIGSCRVAVRSSSMAEDSESASFAGQYETILNVQGLEALRSAIRQCLASAASDRVRVYRETRSGATSPEMHVVVQKMVDARAAGVLFTVNPVNARRDQIVIDAVEGIGDALVSGRSVPHHWVLSREGTVQERDTPGEPALLTRDELAALRRQGLAAEAQHGAPLDLEWAIDRAGEIQWLQARPVTGVVSDLNELDRCHSLSDVYTWSNIGEMMPGAVTPLTSSVTGRGIDLGMQRMYRKLGADIPRRDESRYVASFFGHLFLNLSAMAELSAYVAGSSKASMCVAVCGRDIAQVDEPEQASALRRGLNSLRYVSALLSGRRHGDRLDALVRSLWFPTEGSAAELYRAIDRSLPKIWEAYEHHLLSSSSSGAIGPLLLGIVAKGEKPTTAHHARVAGLLAGATEVESADVATRANRVIDALVDIPEAESRFARATPVVALRWLRSANAGHARTSFNEYLERHGHRAVRELELRQKEWALDPTPLVVSLQSGLRARLESRRTRTTSPPEPKGDGVGRMVRSILPLAHAAVRSRERTKSTLVAATQRFKQAYRLLGVKLCEENLLSDEDAVFFLTHDELGLLIDGDEALADRAARRRKALDFQMALRFPQVVTGRPEPLETRTERAAEGALTGQPVSGGVVSGKARVVRTIEEASALAAGEILIAPITDVGWTPFFALIAGLATDVGSVVSHGAVVAREYGLPAVVNLGTATDRFRTGDWVTLNGDRGTLEPGEPDD